MGTSSQSAQSQGAVGRAPDEIRDPCSLLGHQVLGFKSREVGSITADFQLLHFTYAYPCRTNARLAMNPTPAWPPEFS